MRTSALLGLVGLLAGSFVVGCASKPSDESTEDASGAASGAAAKIETGTYEYDLDLVVKGTQIEGSFYSQVGDLGHGGASCSFTLAGIIENIGGVDHAHITAVDGWSATGGEIVATATGVKVHLNTLPNACQRSSPELADLNDGAFDGRAALGVGTDAQGFRTVQADKTFFYDRAGGAPRAAYVVQMQSVVVTGPESNGFTPVKYVSGTATTKGFLKTADLTAPHSVVAHDTLRASYEIEPNDGIGAGMEVITSDNRDMFFNLIGVNKFGGQNIGDIEMGHAKLVGDTATWQGDGCTIKFAFSSDAKTVQVEQDNACADFGANVVVSGKYNRQ